MAIDWKNMKVTLKKGGDLKEWQVKRIQDLIKKNSLTNPDRNGTRIAKSITESNHLNRFQQAEIPNKKDNHQKFDDYLSKEFVRSNCLKSLVNYKNGGLSENRTRNLLIKSKSPRVS